MGLVVLRVPSPGSALLSCRGHPWTFCCVCRWVGPGRSAGVLRFSCLASSSPENPSVDHSKEAAPSLLKDRLPFIHETGFSNSFSTNGNSQSTMLMSIEKDIDKLESVLIQGKEEICGSDLYPDGLWETQSKFDTLEEELCRLQVLLDLKENSLKALLHEITILRTHLQDAQTQADSLCLYKEASEARQAQELERLERLSLDSLDILDRHLIVNEAMSNSLEKVQNVWESIMNFHNSSVSGKLIGVLQSEASLHFEALVMVTEELAKAEAGVLSLHQKMIYTEELLEKERKSLRAARDGFEELERSLGNEESKVDDLFKEVSSLKGQLEKKETLIQRLSNEVLKNKGLQETARKNLVAFHQSEKKVQQLTMERNALDNQLRSKDLLLEDIRKEAFEKTEALRLAAQIKQDLNLCRHREVKLTQELERERLQVKDLSRELMENSRAEKAELALRQAEKNMMDLNRELTPLRKGIQSRDDVIKLMQEKIDRNIQILQSASEDREAMRKMEAHIQSLESKLKDFQ